MNLLFFANKLFCLMSNVQTLKSALHTKRLKNKIGKIRENRIESNKNQTLPFSEQTQV
jgi:hypothetical protein